MENQKLNTLRNFFLGSNTPLSYISYFSQIGNHEEGWNRYLIKGGPGTGKSSLMKAVIREFANISKDMEVIYCASDPDTVDGVIMNDIKVAIIDATMPHVLEPIFPGVVDNTISICDCWDTNVLSELRDEIIKSSNENTWYQKQAKNYLASAYELIKSNHEILKKHLDNEKLQEYIDKIITKEFKILKKENKLNSAKEQKRFLSCISIEGTTFFEDTIKDIAEKIYVIKDEYGVVSSTILSQLRRELLNLNLEIITCYCMMSDGQKIDHIMVPNLKLAFVTSNNYHKITGKCYKTINFNKFLHKIEDHLEEQMRFNKLMSCKIIDKVIDSIKHAKEIHDELESLYKKAMNFQLVDKKTSEIITKINLLFSLEK